MLQASGDLFPAWVEIIRDDKKRRGRETAAGEDEGGCRPGPALTKPLLQ
jgi:hypothetical protein